jgi:hypothetical protein
MFNGEELGPITWLPSEDGQKSLGGNIGGKELGAHTWLLKSRAAVVGRECCFPVAPWED